MKKLETYISAITKLCELYNVRTLYAFGSVLREDFNQESDIDLLVDFNKMDLKIYADNYFDFKFSLEDILNRPVDLLEEQALKNPYLRDSIIQQRQMVYG